MNWENSIQNHLKIFRIFGTLPLIVDLPYCSAVSCPYLGLSLLFVGINCLFQLSPSFVGFFLGQLSLHIYRCIRLIYFVFPACQTYLTVRRRHEFEKTVNRLVWLRSKLQIRNFKMFPFIKIVVFVHVLMSAVCASLVLMSFHKFKPEIFFNWEVIGEELSWYVFFAYVYAFSAQFVYFVQHAGLCFEQLRLSVVFYKSKSPSSHEISRAVRDFDHLLQICGEIMKFHDPSVGLILLAQFLSIIAKASGLLLTPVPCVYLNAGLCAWTAIMALLIFFILHSCQTVKDQYDFQYQFESQFQMNADDTRSLLGVIADQLQWSFYATYLYACSSQFIYLMALCAECFSQLAKSISASKSGVNLTKEYIRKYDTMVDVSHGVFDFHDKFVGPYLMCSLLTIISNASFLVLSGNYDPYRRSQFYVWVIVDATKIFLMLHACQNVISQASSSPIYKYMRLFRYFGSSPCTLDPPKVSSVYVAILSTVLSLNFYVQLFFMEEEYFSTGHLSGAIYRLIRITCVSTPIITLCEMIRKRHDIEAIVKDLYVLFNWKWTQCSLLTPMLIVLCGFTRARGLTRWTPHFKKPPLHRSTST
ncbi:unnamed protein product [Nesidiocoris tenuis]|uniref:Gustatory receptor n=1 Tax=Nesidiocoris tenuis TaxID=355587 RepID=A0A6H5G7B4_9HEMI|nr:unnamed protein product [Nesidiocoris tenuis]